jgi:membrane-associated protease RseP (regulator of RpoE activity)
MRYIAAPVMFLFLAFSVTGCGIIGEVASSVSDKATIAVVYLKAAVLRDAEAQFALGGRYLIGNGVAQDYGKAVEWFQKAADQGFAPAQFFLGRMYAYGRGVAKDERKAAELLQKAAAQEEYININESIKEDRVLARLMVKYSSKGVYIGTGFSAKQENNQEIIVGITEGGPAHKAGLKPGEILLAVNGETIDKMSREEIIQRVRGPKGTDVELTVMSPNATQARKVRVARDIIKQ